MDQMIFCHEETINVLNNIQHKIQLYKKVKEHNTEIQNIIKVIEENGIDKSTVAYLHSTILLPIFERMDNTDILNSDKYDFLSSNNDSTEILNTLYNLNLSNPTKEDIVKDIKQMYNAFVEQRSLVLDTQKQILNKLDQELSNTSNEVIPAKAKSLSINSYLLSNITFTNSALTIGDDKINTDSILSMIRNIDIKETTPFFSENLLELEDTIREIKSSVLLQMKQFCKTVSLALVYQSVL